MVETDAGDRHACGLEPATAWYAPPPSAYVNTEPYPIERLIYAHPADLDVSVSWSHFGGDGIWVRPVSHNVAVVDCRNNSDNTFAVTATVTSNVSGLSASASVTVSCNDKIYAYLMSN